MRQPNGCSTPVPISRRAAVDKRTRSNERKEGKRQHYRTPTKHWRASCYRGKFQFFKALVRPGRDSNYAELQPSALKANALTTRSHVGCSYYSTSHKLRPVVIPLADAHLFYVLLPFRAAPLLKLLKQNPIYCSLLKSSVGDGYRGDKSFVENMCQHIFK